jgi:hypothetical protein
MDKLFSLLEPLVWLGIAEYVKQKNCSSFHLPLNCATCNVMWQSSVFALLNTLALIARDLMYHKILKLRPREVDITENYFADKSGLAFGSSAAALTIFLVQNHKLGYANERTIDIGKLYAFMASHAGYAMSLTTFLSTLTKLIQFRINGTFSVVEMMPITYILSISRSIYYMNQNIELDLQRIFLFSMIQISLWLLYKDLLGFDKSDTKRNFSPTKNVTSRSRLQYVFTTGEWVVISTFISIVFTDYLVRYVTFNEEISANNLSPDMIVSQAGVTGCLIGVFISRAQNIIQLCKILERVFRVGKKNCFVKSLFPIFIVVCTTILCVSVSLTKYCNDTILNDSFCPKEPMSNKKLDCLTLPFRWLIEYIFQYEYHLYDDCNNHRKQNRNVFWWQARKNGNCGKEVFSSCRCGALFQTNTGSPCYDGTIICCSYISIDIGRRRTEWI